MRGPVGITVNADV